MPPKKKGGKGKNKKGDDEQAAGPKPVEGEPTEKEIIMQKELDQVTEQLSGTKQKLIDVRQDNDFLQQEAQKIRLESHEYMSYMEKKTTKRQTSIVTLSDHNRKEIQDIEDEQKAMVEEYDKKKEALRAILTEKEQVFSKTKEELSELKEYKTLQKEQTATIKELEREVMSMRARHSEKIQKLKNRFLEEKREFQHESDNKITALAKQANKEATHCLSEHTQRIKLENRRLRQNLLQLIRKIQTLRQHQLQLQEQSVQVRAEQTYHDDIKRLRPTRRHQLGLLEEEEETGTQWAITQS